MKALKHWAKKLSAGLGWRGELLKQRGWGKTPFERWLVDMLLLPSDIQQLRKTYKATFGRNPRILFPRTFNEKIQHAKVFARRKRYVQYADKVRVRDFVRSRVGDEFLIPLHWTGTSLMEARTASLPGRFVVKANNGSGKTIMVRDAEHFDWDTAATKTERWLKSSHATFHAEWQYRWILPLLLIEELLSGPGGQPPMDYKFFCFHGRVEYVQVDVDRFVQHKRTIFTRDFEPLCVSLLYPRYEGPLARPACFDEMIQVAEKLSADEGFVRIDLYDAGRPLFGEITISPEAGIGRFSPTDWDRRMGDLW